MVNNNVNFFLKVSLELNVGPKRIMVRNDVGGIVRSNHRLLDCDAGCDEYEVYLTAILRVSAAEALESIWYSRMLGTDLEGIFQNKLIGGDGLVGITLVCHVEVTCHDGWSIPHNFLYLADDEESTLLAGLRSDMIEMGVYRHEYLPRLLVLELAPTGNALQGGIPSATAC